MTTVQENYTAWLAAEIQAAIDDPRPSIPHEEVMARMDARQGQTLHAVTHDGRPVCFRTIEKALAVNAGAD
ncbi:hypothetical protein AwPolaro_07800 [Polaromonas sp.]|nr:hypothetical protein AwPolaro_07800 [Polaromonas sp.]